MGHQIEQQASHDTAGSTTTVIGRETLQHESGEYKTIKAEMVASRLNHEEGGKGAISRVYIDRPSIDRNGVIPLADQLRHHSVERRLQVYVGICKDEKFNRAGGMIRRNGR